MKNVGSTICLDSFLCIWCICPLKLFTLLWLRCYVDAFHLFFWVLLTC